MKNNMYSYSIFYLLILYILFYFINIVIISLTLSLNLVIFEDNITLFVLSFIIILYQHITTREKVICIYIYIWTYFLYNYI